ncbi:MAG: hypothetical protein IBX64_00565 [Actinobacteria bacterium]|nr:hypothetical protein [Actinomycetota bacterium]
MQEPERRQEARAVPPEERAEAPMGVVTPMMRGAYVPAWYSRISWGGVFSGVLIAIAAQMLLSALGVLVGFGTAALTNVQALADISAGVGIWIAISALISTFIGGYVASRLANVRFISDGLWHGTTVWALALVATVLLSTFGVTGLLGFATTAAGALGVTPPAVQVTPADIQTAADVAATSSGYFLLGALLSLGAALLGGWLGSGRISRSEAMEEAGRERMAA